MGKQFRPRAVLVIDGEPLIQWALSAALSRAGHVVVTASDGDGGLRALAAANRPFDVIFVDCRRQDSTENCLLIAIRKSAPRSVVVLMTASHAPDDVSDACRRGVQQVLCKPFDIADVQNIVAAASVSGKVRGDIHGSTRRRDVSVSVSMDSAWDGNETGRVDVRHLSAFR